MTSSLNDFKSLLVPYTDSEDSDKNEDKANKNIACSSMQSDEHETSESIELVFKILFYYT